MAAAIAAKTRSSTGHTAWPVMRPVGRVPMNLQLHYVIARAIAARKLAAQAVAVRAHPDPAPTGPAPTGPAPTGPAPTGTGQFSFAALKGLWEQAGGPAWAAAQAASIAECESGGNPRAYNPSGASGLWQILGQVVSGDLFDPLVNAQNAVAKFRASGDTFAQWVC